MGLIVGASGPVLAGIGVTYHPAEPAVSPKVLPPAVMQAADSGGLLTNRWFAHAVAALTLALVGLLVWRSCRKRPSGPRWQTYLTSLALTAGTVLTAMLTALLYVNAASGFVPNVSAFMALFDDGGGATSLGALAAAPAHPHTPGPPGRSRTVSRNHTGASSGVVDLAPRPRVVSGPGTLVQVAIPDPALGVPVGLTDIYLPAGYAEQAGAGARYPVVYLVHGYPAGRASDWMVSGRAPQALDALEAYGYAQPMVIVSVDASGPSNGQDWECLNTAGGPQLETYLTRDVVAYVDGHLATRAHRGGRAIGGMSGGAFCALNLGLRHQDLYTAIMAIEPFDDPGGQALALLGGSITSWDANSPRLYLPTLHLRTPLTVYLADGSRSGSLPTARRLAGEFERAGVTPLLQVIEGGGHEWTTARIALPYALQAASDVMSRPGHTSA